MRKSGHAGLAKMLAASAVTGLLLTLAAPGILPWKASWLLAWVAFAPLLVPVARGSAKQAAASGFVAGLVLHLGVCCWFPGLIARFAGFHPAAAIGVHVALAAWQAAGWATWAMVASLLARRWSLVLVAPLSFMAFEFLMPMVFDYSVGLTQVHNTLVAQSAELGGPGILGALIVACGAALATVVIAHLDAKPMPWRNVVAVGALLVASLVFGAVRIADVAAQRAAAPILRVGVVQQGAAYRGWSPPVVEDLTARYQRGSERLEREHGGVDVLVWPEKAYGLLRRDAKHDYAAANPRRLRTRFASPLLFGLTSVDPATREVGNAAAFLEADGKLRVVYEKVHLIVYSEWLPSWMPGVVPGGKRYRPGTWREPVEVPNRAAGDPVPVGLFICFEATFPRHVAGIVANGARVLVNLSDDTWFGDSAEPEQHLAHAVFRAIESRRDLVRATGGGVSALIESTGRVAHRTALQRDPATPDVSMVVDARVLGGTSLYARFGSSVPIASVVATMLGLGLLGRRRRGQGLGSGGTSPSQAPPSS